MCIVPDTKRFLWPIITDSTLNTTLAATFHVATSPNQVLTTPNTEHNASITMFLMKYEHFLKGMDTANPVSATWYPQVVGIYQHNTTDADKFLVELSFTTTATTVYGAPTNTFVEVDLPRDKPHMHVKVQWFQKTATRCVQ